MIEAHSFGVGLGRLAAAVRQPLDDLTLEVYFDALKDLGSTEEWTMYVTWCLHADEWSEWIPKLAELRDSFQRWLHDARPKPKQLTDGIVPLPDDPLARASEVRRRFTAGRAALVAELERRGIDLTLGSVVWPEEREAHAEKVRAQVAQYKEESREQCPINPS